MIGHGTYNQPKGSWSDDSSMMLGIMEWLTEMKLKYPTNTLKLIEYEDYGILKNKWIKWFLKGDLTPSGKCFDIGIQTKEALTTDGIHNECSVDESAQGNGALMRILPFAFLPNDDTFTVPYIMNSANAITHGSTVSNTYCEYMLMLS